MRLLESFPVMVTTFPNDVDEMDTLYPKKNDIVR